MDRQVIPQLASVRSPSRNFRGRWKWNHAQCRFTSNQRDIALLQPRNHRGIEACRRLADVPRARLGAPGPTTAADEKSISRLDFHAGVLFPRFEVLDVNWCAGLQGLNAFKPRNIHENAPGKHTVFVVDDRILRGAALLRYVLLLGVSVISLAIHEVVTQSIE